MSTDRARICNSCGYKFTEEQDFCPVCAFRSALNVTTDSKSTVELEETPKTAPRLRFGHYEVVNSADGTPIELGRGAMGVTYKALDVELRCVVALKVINERYLGDDTMCLRFLREARAAASIRHPNIASVFHLGRIQSSYFYVMEFVEGETLEALIQRSGRLTEKLAVEIAVQVASGLAAVHKQKLVHRDIKPSNVMVRLENESAATVKIIDLGLAKSLNEMDRQTAISTPGAFVGTPEFASPEQFAGAFTDIRSDLYSLGITLWKTVTGKMPFQGTPSALMRHHQQSPLPLQQLRGIPQPIAVLLEILLEKDPARRFQSPAELLKVIPAITAAIDEKRRITRRTLSKMPDPASRTVLRRHQAKSGPARISLARLPVTGSELFGREEDIARLHNAWMNRQTNIFTVVAWAGVGKSTLVNHWLKEMAARRYRSAEHVFGWSFYTQGTSGGPSSADEFISAALTWFGDEEPRSGTEWEKGERLAKLVTNCRTLLILDGLEPLQNPPGPQEGRLRDTSLQAFLRELATFNRGLCVITTRIPVADIAEYQHSSAPRHELEELSCHAGARLLQASGVKGAEEDLQSASSEFRGHCLALTLLGSYLTDAYNGDIRYREEVSARLIDDTRQGAHARKVMASYQAWFGEGPELSVLRMLGLFDRPVDEEILAVLLGQPVILALTESLTNLSPTQWRSLISKLRRARLLAGEDPHRPGLLDTHPLVREYFGDQLRSERPKPWQECNTRLYTYFRALPPQLPDCVRDMEPLFLAIISACNAGLYREALHDIYIPRIQRGNAFFASRVLGVRGALVSVLSRFFEPGRWGSPAEARLEEHKLTKEDQLFVLMQAALLLTATRGVGVPEARICYERSEALCRRLNRPADLYAALMGQLRHSSATDKLTITLRLAEKIYSLAGQQNEPALMIGACRGLASTLYFLGDFESARNYARKGVEIWRSGKIRHLIEEVTAPAVACLYNEALSEWHLGELELCHATMEEAIALANETNDIHGLAASLSFAGFLAQCERRVVDVERFASNVIEMSARHDFALWLARAKVLRGWVRSVSGNPQEGIVWIKDGIAATMALGTRLMVPYMLVIKAEALHLADQTAEAAEMLNEADIVAKYSEERWLSAELLRLRGVFLAATDGENREVETLLLSAIETAKQQKSVPFTRRAEATYAEYQRQKNAGPEQRRLRLPLC